ncbi:unnamed protein product [Effrenium voratum]|uniref:Uncharacterized protein n=1 Tax=Effrenium voratum TaxID=2562239 RepID=A0AA36N3D8_9DINO|nr:unnamed protein product [Effrenium voratum]CAJ1397130.1 unnamed protein product [Effrenium voratum]CAJ1420699.1 unnamed protein product [Effrenium voratum]
MAAMHFVILALLMSASSAMFKRDMRQVMEEEFPDLKSLGDTVSNAAKEAQQVVKTGTDAVQGAKDLALDTFEQAVAQVNKSLEVVGGDIQRMNITAESSIQGMDKEVSESKDKAKAFASSGLTMLNALNEQVDKVLAELKAVPKMAEDVLTGLNQKKAALSLDKAMESALDLASNWQKSLQEMTQQLKAVLGNFAQGNPANATNGTNGTNATMIALQIDPQKELADLSDALQRPLADLSDAADNLKSVASKTQDALGNFVDAGVEAAQEHLPKDLVANVTTMFKGVQAKAVEQLSPLADVGAEVVNGLYSTAAKAGLDLKKSSALRASVAALLPLALFWLS